METNNNGFFCFKCCILNQNLRNQHNHNENVLLNVTYDFGEEPLRDRFHRPPYLYPDPMACFVLSEPVAALVLTVKPLQPWPSVDGGS